MLSCLLTAEGRQAPACLSRAAPEAERAVSDLPQSGDTTSSHLLSASDVAEATAPLSAAFCLRLSLPLGPQACFLHATPGLAALGPDQ